jgi:hypothetical protein
LENLIFACAKTSLCPESRYMAGVDKTDLEIEAIEAKEMRSGARPKGQHSQRSACCAVLLALRAITACNGSVSGARAPTRYVTRIPGSVEEGGMW